MLPSTGYFKAINCPFYENGYCERPYCHFRHSRRDGASISAAVTLDSTQTVSKTQNADLPTVAAANSDVIQQLVSEAVKKVLADQNVKDTDNIINQVVEGLKPKLVPSVLSTKPNQETNTEDPALSKHIGIPVIPSSSLPCVYNPTPIAELKKRHIPITAYEPTRESKAVKRKSPDVERPWMDVIRNITCIKESKFSYTPTVINQTITGETNSMQNYVPTIKSEASLNLYDVNSSSNDSYIPEKKNKKEIYYPKPKKRREEYVPRKPKVPLKTKQHIEDDSYDVLDEFLCGSKSNASIPVDEESQDFNDIVPKFSDDDDDEDDGDVDDDGDGDDDDDDDDDDGDADDTTASVDITKEEKNLDNIDNKISHDEKENKELKKSDERNNRSYNKNSNRLNKERSNKQEVFLKHKKEDVSKAKNRSLVKSSKEDSKHSKHKNDSKHSKNKSEDDLKHSKSKEDNAKHSKTNEQDSRHSKNKQEDLKHNKNKDRVEDKKEREKDKDKSKDKQKHSSKSSEHSISSSKVGKNKEKAKVKDNRNSKENLHHSKKDSTSNKRKRSNSKDLKSNKKECKEKTKHKSDDKNKHKSKSSSSNSKSKSSKQSHKSSNKHSSHKSKKSNNKSAAEGEGSVSDKNDEKSDRENKCDSPEYEEFSPFYDEQLLETSDSDHDVEEECRKIFQEYEISDHPKIVSNKAPARAEVEEPEEVFKKRVAHPSATSNASTKHVGPTQPPKRLPNPQQRMYERWRMMKEVAAEKAAEKAAARKTAEATVQRKPLENNALAHNDHQINGNGRIRIAQVPYAMSLALEKKKVLEQAAKIETKTVAQNKKGSARVAHIPQVVPQLIRPEPLQMSGTQKFPLNVRQFYVNAMQNICVQIYTNSDDAAQRAVREEFACYERCKAVNVYKNSCMLTVHRLRKEVDQKSKESSTPNSGTISHEAVLAGKVKGSWSVIKPRKAVTEFRGVSLYNMLTKWIMTEQELKDNSYPRPHPDGPKGRAKLYSSNARGQSNLSKVPNERFCCRCNKGYIVDRNGFPIRKENCIYHYARKFTFRGESKYMCCKQDGSSDGCCDATTHVWDFVDAENLRGYVSTFDKSVIAEEQGIFALDCEMCYTTQGLELTRVTVINEDNHVVYETLVKPTHPIIDFNTRFSGISEKDMANVTTTLLDVQATLLSMFSSKTILVGHSLESDFKALKLLHNTVVDTSVMFPHKNGPPCKRALKNLCSEYLRKIIQNDVGGHDSKEDAIACMELILWKVKEEAKLQ